MWLSFSLMLMTEIATPYSLIRWQPFQSLIWSLLSSNPVSGWWLFIRRSLSFFNGAAFWSSTTAAPKSILAELSHFILRRSDHIIIPLDVRQEVLMAAFVKSCNKIQFGACDFWQILRLVLFIIQPLFGDVPKGGTVVNFEMEILISDFVLTFYIILAIWYRNWVILSMFFLQPADFLTFYQNILNSFRVFVELISFRLKYFSDCIKISGVQISVLICTSSKFFHFFRLI